MIRYPNLTLPISGHSPTFSARPFLRPDPTLLPYTCVTLGSIPSVVLISCPRSIWATLKPKSRDRFHRIAEVINGLPVLPVIWKDHHMATVTKQRVREQLGEVGQIFRFLE